MSYFKVLLVVDLIISSLFVQIRFSFTRWSHFWVIVCQSAMSGMFKNISLLNTKLPGLLPNVVCTPVRMACMAVYSASSMKSFALVTSWGGSPCSNVCKMLPNVWCMRLQIALACGFWLDVGASLVLQLWRRNWNSGPTNSPPLLCTHLAGHGYLDNQTCAYFCATCADVFLLILTRSTKLETVSITLRALNLSGFLNLDNPWSY